MKIVFIGTKGEIEENFEKHSRYSSFYIEHKGKRVLFEFGADKTEKDLEEIKPDWIVISHAHPDHAFGLLKVHPDAPVYMSAKSLMALSKKKGFDASGVETFKRNLRGPFKLDDAFTIEVFPVEHSVVAPAVAMKIHAGDKTIFYSGDIAYMPDIVEKLKGVDLYIGDGSYLEKGNIRRENGQLIGHASIRTQLGWLKKAGVKQAIFTHFGSWVKDANLRSVFTKLSREFGINVHAAWDGRTFVFRGSKLDKLVLPGLYLVPPHARYIWEGRKTLIVKTKNAPKDYIGQPIFFLEDQKVYGILMIDEVHGPFDAQAVREKLRHRHLITDEEWEAWAKEYPSWNKQVYCYEFTVLDRFDKPVYYEPAPGTQVWIKEVELQDFVSMSREEFKKYISSLDDKAILHWHAKTHTWWNRLKEGKKIKFTEEQIKMMHDVIHEVLRERGYHPTAALLQVSDKDLAPVASSGVETHEKAVTWKDIVKRAKPFYFLRPAILLVGGVVTRKEGSKHDIDWFINYSRRIPERDKAIEFRLGRQFPDLADRFSFNYRQIEGPFTDYIPVYDFLAIPSNWKEPVRMESFLEELCEFLRSESMFSQLEMSAEAMARWCKENDKVKPLYFCLPAKPVVGHKPGEKYTLESVAELFAEDEFPVYVEKKYDGNWLQLCKEGDKIRIYRISGEDCTDRLPGTVEEMKKWPVHTVTVISDSEKWTADGEYVPREIVAGYLSGKSKPDDTGIVHNLFDCIYFWDPKMQKHDLNCQAGDIHNEPLYIRKKYLELLPITQKTGDAPSIKTHFNLAYYMVAKNRKELIRYMKKAAKFEASEGAVVKVADSKYPLTGACYKWAKYKKTADVHAIVLKVIPRKTPGVYGYRVGVRIPAGWKAMRTAKIGDKVYMDVGKTGNIKKKLKVGDIVVVSFEELFYYHDPETDERQLVLYVPEIVSWRPEQNVPDTAEEAIMNAEKVGVLVKKTGRLSYTRSEMEAAGWWT